MRGRVILRAALPAFFVSLSFGYDWGTNPGTGEPNTPYQISEPNQLIAIGSNADLLDKCFILTNDIIFDPNNNPDHIFTAAVIAQDISANGGYQGTPFTGFFNGNGHIIRNLTIGTPESDYAGLFGSLGSGGQIFDLGVKNIHITGHNYIGGLAGENRGFIISCHATGEVSGGEWDVGGLCGWSQGTISQCYAAGTVSGWRGIGGLCGVNSSGTISYCTATSSISAIAYVGGLCGYNNRGTINYSSATGTIIGQDIYGGGLCGHNNHGTINYSYATGSVSGLSEYTGGLCGRNYYGTINRSYASGSVTGNCSMTVGGLCGTNASGTISQCYATGTVVGYAVVGGLCGYNNGTISQCYASGPVSAPESVGGLCGTNDSRTSNVADNYWDTENTKQPNSAGGWGLTSAEMKQADNFLGWNDGTWTIDEGVDTPRLFWENRPGATITTDYPVRTYTGSGTADDPYQIADGNDLVCLSRRTPDWSSHFMLTDDINMSGWSFPQAVIAGGGGTFNGMLNGRGHVIFNLTVAGPGQDYIGLISYVDSGAQVKNLGIENASIIGDYHVGGICGSNYEGTIRQSYAISTVSGSNHVGGLCGSNSSGTISQCYAAGTVSGSDNVGGLCGWNSSSTISRCYAAGTVSGSDNVGGLCGRNSAGTVSSGYFLVTAGPDNGLGEPLDDPNMMIRSNFEGWDFADDGSDGPNNFWRMCEDGVDYPQLSWEVGQYGDYACPDGIGMDDLEVLAFAWLTDDSDPDFNYACDGGGDGRVNQQEMQILSTHWKE